MIQKWLFERDNIMFVHANIFAKFVDFRDRFIRRERVYFNRLVLEDRVNWFFENYFYNSNTLVNEASYWFPRWYRSNHVNCLPTYTERLERGHSYPGHWFQSTFF